MTATKPLHTFHIPVMGLAFTIDSPIKVAHYGISSVVSIIDDELLEKMSVFYSTKFNLSHQEISTKEEDSRAKRVTAYLNLVDKIVKQKFDHFKNELTENKKALENFISILPNKSEVKKNLRSFLENGGNLKENLFQYLEKNLLPGNIDVNIMTKVDKDNFVKDEQLPVIFNDAHASLRGFANSNLESGLVLSAGMNPRLYSYIENFADFYPDSTGYLKKKIILKVSDFRSAMIQGNFLAKKGIWVSEYRIESGLNCGGHAFATDGYLLGPILEEFKQKKEQLIQSAHDLIVKALAQKGMTIPNTPLELKITVQGGVGTAEEHDFLLDHYQVDSVGWGSPFLLVPEATSVDQHTRDLLIKAKEEDLYLSNISPLGVPFNTLRGTTNEMLKLKRIQDNKAGSSCPKKYLALSKEIDPQGICTASKKYQDIKLQALESEKHKMSRNTFDTEKFKITEKACLCVGLANAAYLENDIEIKGQKQGVVICPGPNMAYFDKEVSLSDMLKHIYGNGIELTTENRPNMFVKELRMYIDYLKKDIASMPSEITPAQTKKWNTFKNNLLDGIAYYQSMFASVIVFEKERQNIEDALDSCMSELTVLFIPS